jgi:copper(I)-binding protein
MLSFLNAPSRHPSAGRPINFTRQIKRLAFAAALLTTAAQAATAHEYKLGDLEIKHPSSRATLPGAKVAAGYVVIVNKGATPDRLVSVSAEIAGKTEIHEMAVTDGVMTMRPLKDGVEVPANGEVKLERGSYHIMFMDLQAPAVEGVKFKGTLTFEKAGTLAIEFAVEKASGEGHTSHGG